MSNDKKLGFVMMLDVSGSMSDAVNMVKIDAKAFVRQARSGDQFAVNRFSDDAKWVYPVSPNPKLVTVSPSLKETADAKKYIEQLQTYNMTNMGEAIRLANQIMKDSTITADLKAYVMLSDGAHNWGADPVDILGTEPPIYIAALGWVSRQYFDRLIRKNSKSRFYNQPNAYQMMLMFNQILADSTDSGLMLNNLNSYDQGSDSIIKTFQISEKDNAVKVNVVWSDAKYKYTSENPKNNQVNIVLIDPDDRNTDIRPDIAEEGYCIFHLENVKPGEWKVLIQYSVAETITGTIGGIDFHTDIKADLMLPSTASRNQPIDIGVLTMDGDHPLENLKVTAQISKPKIAVSEWTDQYGDRISRCLQTDTEEAGNLTEEAAINKIREDIMLSEGRDIFEQQVIGKNLSVSKNGDYNVRIEDVKEDGIYNVEVKIQGINSKTGLPFTRIKSGAVSVE